MDDDKNSLEARMKRATDEMKVILDREGLDMQAAIQIYPKPPKVVDSSIDLSKL